MFSFMWSESLMISAISVLCGHQCMCWLGPRWGVLGATGLGLGFTNSGGTWRKWDKCLCFGCGGVGVGGVGGEWMGGLGLGLGGWDGVMYVCVVSLDYLC